MQDLVQNDVEERVIATQYAFDVAAGVHFEREGFLHVGSKLWPTFAHRELLMTKSNLHSAMIYFDPYYNRIYLTVIPQALAFDGGTTSRSRLLAARCHHEASAAGPRWKWMTHSERWRQMREVTGTLVGVSVLSSFYRFFILLTATSTGTGTSSTVVLTSLVQVLRGNAQ